MIFEVQNIFEAMADETSIRQQAKAQLLAHLQKGHGTIMLEKQETAGEYLVVKSGTGRRHDILVQLLNLDEARSISIPQSAFNYEMRDGQWILLVLYMHDMEPFSYLIPTSVFRTPNNIFVSNEQKPEFRHLSTWEIKVFRNGIQELSRYALDTAVIL